MKNMTVNGYAGDPARRLARSVAPVVLGLQGSTVPSGSWMDRFDGTRPRMARKDIAPTGIAPTDPDSVTGNLMV